MTLFTEESENSQTSFLKPYNYRRLMLPNDSLPNSTIIDLSQPDNRLSSNSKDRESFLQCPPAMESISIERYNELGILNGKYFATASSVDKDLMENFNTKESCGSDKYLDEKKLVDIENGSLYSGELISITNSDSTSMESLSDFSDTDRSTPSQKDDSKNFLFRLKNAFKGIFKIKKSEEFTKKNDKLRHLKNIRYTLFGAACIWSALDLFFLCVTLRRSESIDSAKLFFLYLNISFDILWIIFLFFSIVWAFKKVKTLFSELFYILCGFLTTFIYVLGSFTGSNLGYYFYYYFTTKSEISFFDFEIPNN